MGRSGHVAWLFALVLGCDTCAGGALATLEQHSGSVERDFAAEAGKWQAAADGASFTIGDGLRTLVEAGAVLELHGGGELRVESETTIRFRTSDQAALAVDVEQGEAVIEAGDEALSLSTEFGLAMVSAQSEVRVRGEGQGRRIEVAFGAAQVPNAEGALRVLEQGQHIDVGFGAAQIVEDAPAAEAEPVAQVEAEPVAGNTVAVQVVGEGVRQRASGDEAWQPLAAGEGELAADTVLELPAGTHVALSRGDERVTLEGAGNYQLGSGAGPLVRSLAGGLTVHATAGDVVIEVPGGHIVARGGLEGGTRARLSVAGDVTHVEVEAGRVAALHAGEDFDLAAGDTADLGAAEEEPTEEGTAGGERAPDFDQGIAFAELIVPAGQSASIYDPSPPTAVGFVVADVCPEGAQVRAGRKRAAGEGQINLALDHGLHGYRVYCRKGSSFARRAAKTGRIRIVRSAGTRQLPKTAPKNRVELDGRRYTVLFSNRKPAIEVHWPTAPPGSTYTVHAKLAGGAKLSDKSSGPRHTFAAGTLPEGEHRVSMSAASGERSRETTVVVRFDNAAPTASLRKPAPEGFAAGVPVAVGGVVLPGSTVSVNGEELTLDHQLRFDTELPPQGDRRAIAIRIDHPHTGVRYYLRRAKAL